MIIQKIKEIAEKIKFGTIVVTFTISRGKIKKAEVKNTQEIVLFDS